MKLTSGLDARIRQLSPLLLLCVLFLLVFEPWLPGLGWMRTQFGNDVVLRGCAVVLAFYVLLLWSETTRLHTVLTGVLQAFRDFGSRSGGTAGKPSKTRLEAGRLLIAALGSEDPSVREMARQNLAKIAGSDLGADPAAWQEWLRKQETTSPEE